MEKTMRSYLRQSPPKLYVAFNQRFRQHANTVTETFILKYATNLPYSALQWSNRNGLRII